MAIKGKQRTWILDDGRAEEVQALAEELDCHYVRRLSSNGAKLRTSTTRCRSPKATSSASLMSLLAADIASSANGGKASAGGAASFPHRRTSDAYAGHSWASGSAPFADGNNQESSSEAVTAWTGLALWAKADGNANLATEATWMLSTEAQSGHSYWTNFDASEPVYSGYGHKIVALNWGGKRDYATWFSPEPAAMLGILLIPVAHRRTWPVTRRASKRTSQKRPEASLTRSSATTC